MKDREFTSANIQRQAEDRWTWQVIDKGETIRQGTGKTHDEAAAAVKAVFDGLVQALRDRHKGGAT